MKERKLLTTKNVVLIGMLGALSGVLMLFEIPLPFIAPPFYKLDAGDLPALIGAFSLGSAAGALIEFIKILIKLLFRPTTTAFVGEFANFVIGCAMVVPASAIYHFNRTKKGAQIGLFVGTVCIGAIGALVNVTVMIPFFSKVMPLEKILALGAAIYPAIGSVWGLVLYCVVPFNLIKGVLLSLLTILLYKRVSYLINKMDF